MQTPIRTETGFIGFAPPCGILDKYIYPIDTVNLKGYLYEYNNENKFITIFSPDQINPKENDFMKILTKEKNAVYYETYFFNYATPYPNSNVTHESSAVKDSLITKSNSKERSFIVRKIEGKFIVGITNTNRLNGILSHHYRFKQNKKVFVVTPY